MKRLPIDRTLWWAMGALLAAFGLSEFTSIDLVVQDHLYDVARGQWLVEGKDPVLRALFYTGPKVGIILVGLFLLIVAVASNRGWERLQVKAWGQKEIFVALLTLVSVPTFISSLKATTNVFCPSELRTYGGDVPYVRVLECYPAGDRPKRKGRCFPAGHASGGFALIAMCGLPERRRTRVLALVFGLGVGSIMGFYQMAKGAHFITHTLITALISWIFFLGWRRAFLLAARIKS